MGKKAKQQGTPFLVIFSIFCILNSTYATKKDLTKSSASSPLPPLQLQGSQFVDPEGKPIELKGFNYFGFNNGGQMVHGLWGNDPIKSDFATVVQRQKALGFNAVRLPFSFVDLAISPARSFTFDCPTMPSALELGSSVTPPGYTATPIADLPNPPARTEGKCNDYLPSTSVRDRFLWVIKFFIQNGFYVMIDNHAREDPTVLESKEAWVSQWAALAEDLMSDPEIAGRIIFDILNEPDELGLRWEATDSNVALKDLYIDAMDAIENVAPRSIFAIEGAGQLSLGTNLGDGYATDVSILEAEPSLSDPRPFFDALLEKPYRSRTLLSPHVYPPSVTFSNAPTQYGQGLWDRLTASFGTKTADGYCSTKNNSDCQVFPVAIGEFGSKFENPIDNQALLDLANYLNDEEAAAEFQHDPIPNWFYWSWNANSGDTGGLVSDNWVNLEWRKIGYLESIGLKPDYLDQARLMSTSLQTVPLPPLKVEGATLVTPSGNPVKIQGFNWFGFNNGGDMLNGLWSNDPLQSDFATVVRRQRALGFNGVRLPFSFKDLAVSPARSYEFGCSSLPNAQEIGASVTPPGQNAISAPELASPPARAPGRCNDYLPSTSVWDRFVWVVKFFVDNGFYVMIDNHGREDRTFLDDNKLWLRSWAALAKDILSDESLVGKVIFDILNEPDNKGIKWEATGGNPALTDLYINAMDAIYAETPDAIFTIQGTGQTPFGTNWGDGFITDPDVLEENEALSDPRPFFDTLLTKPYRSSTILGPHVYPPTVTFNSSPSQYGKGLWNRLTLSFGTKTKTGYCLNDDCQLFPAMIGEFGSTFTNPVDEAPLRDLALYINNEGAAKSDEHTGVNYWFYWCWNANSGDTGGIVDNSWVNIEWRKINYLMDIGLQPLYTIVSPGEPPATTAPPQTTQPPATTAPPQTTKPPETSPPITVPPITPEPPAGKSTCEIRAVISNPWGDSQGYSTAMNIFVKNLGSKQINTPWTLELNSPNYLQVKYSWNWNPTIATDGTIVGKASMSWQNLLPNIGNEINIGMILVGKTTDFPPVSARLNGEACTLVIDA